MYSMSPKTWIFDEIFPSVGHRTGAVGSPCRYYDLLSSTFQVTWSEMSVACVDDKNRFI